MWHRMLHRGARPLQHPMAKHYTAAQPLSVLQKQPRTKPDLLQELHRLSQFAVYRQAVLHSACHIQAEASYLHACAKAA